MAANLQPITSDGGFTSGGNINLNGNLNLPLNSVVYETNIPDGALSGSAIALKPAGGTTANQQLLIYPTAADGDHVHLTSGNLYATELFLGSDNLYVKLANTGNVVINSNDGNSNTAMWTFDTTGNLTLPGNTFAVNYANGTQVSIGGGGNANTGNVTFDDNIVIGTGDEFGSTGLFLAPGNGSIANSAVQYLRVRGGDAPTHIHLDTGNNQFYDQYFGDDAKYVKLELGDAGNVVIGTDDANGNQYNWSFTSDGNLILADGNSIITSVANSSLDPNNANVSTMVFTPDQNYTSQSLVIDPTGPSHIHLRAPGANIDEPDANIFLGGEDSSFEVGYYNGAAPNLFVHSGGNTWTFDTTGILVFPRDTGPNTTDPILTITGGANPKILSEDASETGPANLEITALNTIFTGSSGSAIKIYPDDGEVASDGNLQIWANSGGNTEYSWTFGTDGTLTLPGNLVINGLTNVFGSNVALLQSNNDAPLLSVSSGSNGGVSSLWVEDIGNVGTSNIAAVYANPTSGSGIVRIAVGQNGGNGGPNLWDFGTDGNLTIPGSSGGFIKTVANASIGIAAVDNGTNNPAQLLSMTNAGAATSIVSAYATNATIQTNATGTINTWAFDSAGNLTLPANAFAINYANGTQVSLGGSSSNISNGNSNVSIATANGNVTIAAVGNTTMTVTGTGANVTGTLSASGNITGGNISTGVVTLTNGAVIKDTAGNSVAFGEGAGTTSQGNSAVAIGLNAGNNNQGVYSVAVGYNAGNNTQGVSAVAIGVFAGNNTQGDNAVAIGVNAGNSNQGLNSIAIGIGAGYTSQGEKAVAIGLDAGKTSQGENAVAVGENAGLTTQGNSAVSIGYNAGNNNQGSYSVAIGYGAGQDSQANTSIIINATGNILNQTVANTFTVSPVRNDVANIAQVMFYNTTSKEVTYGNTISIAGNANVGNLNTTTAIITTGNITTINSGLLQNGNSNITLTANGNVSIQAAGSNVELVVTSTGANITGTLSATGNITGSYLISAHASGNEGGEISLAQPPNGNLSGGITIDAYQNTLRMFEQGGTARGLSIDIANSPAGGGTAIGYRDIPQVAAGNVTLAATDAGKHYYSTTAGNLTLTIPLNSTVPFTTGTAISIVVQAAGNILVNAASGVTLYMAGNSTAANRVVGGYGMATLMKVASDTWFINGAGVA